MTNVSARQVAATSEIISTTLNIFSRFYFYFSTGYLDYFESAFLYFYRVFVLEHFIVAETGYVFVEQTSHFYTLIEVLY